MEPAVVSGSPLPAAAVATAAIRRSQLRHDGEALYWLEQRPEENGRGVIVRWSAEHGCQDRVPTGAHFSVRSRVHEYGGGEFAVQNGALVFSAEPEQQIGLLTKAGELRAISIISEPDSRHRFADFCWHPNGQWFYAVREQHRNADVSNDLVAVTLSGEVQVIATGADFYAAPTVSPDGSRLAWLQWSHPCMPWDGTYLMQATLATPSVLRQVTLVMGGDFESVLQPWFDASNRLFALSDRSGYWQPGVVQSHGWQALVPELLNSETAVAQSDCAVAPWSLGIRTWVANERGEIWLIASANGFQQLWQLTEDSAGHYRAVRQPISVDCLGPHIALHDDTVFVLGASADRAEHLLSMQPLANTEQVICPAPAWPPQSAVTPAQSFSVVAGDLRIPTFLYRPALQTTPLPLVLFCHSGPTGTASPGLQPAIQFWTSRGYLVADVNYRGSDGFGRRWRQSLLGHWGEYDVADCLAVIETLVAQGVADPRRIFVRGNSAGGLTALHLLAATDRVRAAALRYPVVDLPGLAAISHKFESRYLHRLAGADGSDGQRLVLRSPASVFHRLQTPILVQQGDQDPVVPLAQAELLIAALAESGIDHELKVHAGEGHGFRRAHTLIAALETECAFFSRHQ